MAKETAQQVFDRISKAIAKDLVSFNKLITEYAEKYPKASAIKLQQTMVLEAIRRVVLKTPVGNPKNWKNPGAAKPGYVGGRARGGWQTQKGPGSDKVIDRIDASGDKAIKSATSVASRIDDFGLVTIFNNTPYIIPLENGHSSVQAPGGMVRLTIAELKQAFP